MDIEEVIRLYGDQYFAKKRYRPRRPHAGSTEDRAMARTLLAWCSAHMVDVRTLLRLHFEYMWREHRACPRFDRLRVASLVPRAQRAEASEAAAATQTEEFVQVVRDLTLIVPSHEQVRRRYYLQQKQTLCEANATSGGYDPRSHFCPSCPRAATCAASLNAKWGFDVSALRSGNLALVPTVVRKALRGWDGSVSV